MTYHLSLIIDLGGNRRDQDPFFSFSFVFSWLPCVANFLSLGIEYKFSL